MSKAPTYTIKTVDDFAAVPVDRRALCLQEFLIWLGLRDIARSMLDGIPVKWADVFTWIDDDKHTATVNVHVGKEKITIAHGVMRGFEP